MLDEVPNCIEDENGVASSCLPSVVKDSTGSPVLSIPEGVATGRSERKRVEEGATERRHV